MPEKVVLVNCWYMLKQIMLSMQYNPILQSVDAAHKSTINKLQLTDFKQHETA
jgi:hypothetical protein